MTGDDAGGDDRPPLDDLTPRKREIIELLRDRELQGRELAEELGIGVSAVRDHVADLRHDHGFTIHSKRGKSRGYMLDEYVPNTKQEAAVAADLDGGGLTYRDMEAEHGLTKNQAQELLDRLANRGHTISEKIVDETTGQKLFYIPDEEDQPWKMGDGDGTYRFALISDTHLGSKSCHLRELHDFYDELEDRGVTTVFHAGDLTDGWQVHKGHINEVVGVASGWGRLKDYTVEHYPERKGIDTLFVEGNHDRKYYKRNQIHFGQLIDNARADLHYVGDCSARFIFYPHDDPYHEIDLELVHPRGGKPYTAGYRGQTLYRERPIEARPTISGLGHLHEKAWFDTHGVEVIYPACWKGITTWGKRAGYAAKIGGWIIDLTIRDGRIREIDPSFIKYPTRAEEDRYTMTDVAELTSGGPQI